MTLTPMEPQGWQDRSAYRFIAPERKGMVGRVMATQLPPIRAQLSITWEDVPQVPGSLADLINELRPLPFGVTHVSTSGVTGSPPTMRRVFRFQDPIHGWMIQQSQTFVVEDERLYTILLTADPLGFSVAEQEAMRSRKVVQLIGGALCQ